MKRPALVFVGLFLALTGVSFAGESDAEGEVSSFIVPPPVRPSIEVEAVLGGVGSPTRFLFVAGSNFRPRDSNTTYSYLGAGCMRRASTAGESWFTYNLQIPDGAIIDDFRVYYYDNSGASDVNSELWAFNGSGGTTLIAEADSSSTPGYSSTGSGNFSYSVNPLSNALTIVASIQGTVDLALCGARVRYQFADPIFSDGFESGSTSAW